MNTTEVLTADDLLRINEAIVKERADSLTSEKATTNDEHQVLSVCSLLHNLYSPSQQYPLLMEVAIACYRFLTLTNAEPFSMKALSIVFGAVYKNELAFYGLTRQSILHTDLRTHIYSLDTVDALIHILEIFHGM